MIIDRLIKDEEPGKAFIKVYWNFSSAENRLYDELKLRTVGIDRDSYLIQLW